MSDHSRRPVLVADIGGTNARFALADTERKQPLIAASVKRYAVADFAAPEAAVRQYLDDMGEAPRQAVFAVAGHIHDGVVDATNSPWQLSVGNLRRALDFETARLINDFAAQSLCLPLLGPDDMRCIGAPAVPEIGTTATQTFAVIGPGTGLGVGALLLRDGHFHALETEGGHAGFAPDTPEEIEILRFLNARFGHVSNERLISGDGLALIHEALAAIDGTPADPLTPETITTRATAGTDAGCLRAVECFCAIFGAVAGDAVLALGGWDGAYLAGGLPPRLLPWLTQGTFRQRFEAKGRLGAALRRTPSVIITLSHAGLLGAAASAVVMRGGSLLPSKV